MTYNKDNNTKKKLPKQGFQRATKNNLIDVTSFLFFQL